MRLSTANNRGFGGIFAAESMAQKHLNMVWKFSSDLSGEPVD
jgi:hypothetical protein